MPNELPEEYPEEHPEEFDDSLAVDLDDLQAIADRVNEPRFTLAEVEAELFPERYVSSEQRN